MSALELAGCIAAGIATGNALTAIGRLLLNPVYWAIRSRVWGGRYD